MKAKFSSVASEQKYKNCFLTSRVSEHIPVRPAV